MPPVRVLVKNVKWAAGQKDEREKNETETRHARL